MAPFAAEKSDVAPIPPRTPTSTECVSPHLRDSPVYAMPSGLLRGRWSILAERVPFAVTPAPSRLTRRGTSSAASVGTDKRLHKISSVDEMATDLFIVLFSFVRFCKRRQLTWSGHSFRKAGDWVNERLTAANPPIPQSPHY